MAKKNQSKFKEEIKDFLSVKDRSDDEITDFLGEKGLNQEEIDKYIDDYNHIEDKSDTNRPAFLGDYVPLADDQEIEDIIRGKLEGIAADEIDGIKILADVYDLPTKKWHSLGNAIENLSLADLDADKTTIKDMIGNAYGPGWYICKVHAAGKIRARFALQLSDRKYKDPRFKEGAPAGNSSLDALSTMMIAQAKEDTKRLELQLSETRKENHDLMMKMFENKSNQKDPIEYLKIGMEMNKKDNSSDTIMKEMFGLIKTGMTIREDAKEAKDGQDLIARIGENVIDHLPDIISNLSGGKLSKQPASVQVAAQLESKGSAAPGTADKNEKVIDTNKIDPAILQIAAKNGAYIGLLASIYLGVKNEDPYEAFSEQITMLELYAELAEVIKKESDDVVIGRLCTLSPGILEYFKDDKYKNYVITIFKDVRKNIAIETEIEKDKFNEKENDAKEEV